jgi:hypothetical protein
MPTDVVGTFTFSSAAGFGRQPPSKRSPSSLNAPLNVASRGSYDTEIVTESSPTSHRYGRGVGDMFE